ncbi:hypothetical protein BJ998_004060 [Kutzneria kofuensis]|uniref:Uncharacterized protein n=1 Tax=Kutzneria kofuensis TaxID=103725 RepID=A0A7W9KJA8_9PSEU|nr:hypothetical protein [Kutzneria kofuensis]
MDLLEPQLRRAGSSRPAYGADYSQLLRLLDTVMGQAPSQISGQSSVHSLHLQCGPHQGQDKGRCLFVLMRHRGDDNGGQTS